MDICYGNRKDKTMATKNTEMFTIDSDSLSVEELEERLEMAALFATKASSSGGEQVVASVYTDPSCWANMHEGCTL
jgi:hypothetical protein